MLKHGLIVAALAAGVVGAGSGCESHAGNGALIGGAAGAGAAPDDGVVDADYREVDDN